MFFFIVFLVLGQAAYYGFSGVLSKEERKKTIPHFNSAQEVKEGMYGYNPNYIDDHKGYVLGLSNEQIDRIIEYRLSGRYINTLADFKRIAAVPDRQLDSLVPLLRFQVPAFGHELSENKKVVYLNAVKTELNDATAEDLEAVYGIGSILSKRIIKYRNLLGAFVNFDQLKEIYGLENSVIENVKQRFVIRDHSKIKKIDVNSASLRELASNVYIDYDMAREIVKYRTKVGEITDIEELLKITRFYSEKSNLIALYLSVNINNVKQ